MKNNIQSKLVFGFGMCVLLMVVLAGINFAALRKLESLNHETLKRSLDMELAVDAQHIGEDLYLIIANAVINRQMAKTEKDWAAAKVNNRDKLRRVALAADSEVEHADVKAAEQAFEKIILIFEREMLPLIRGGAKVPGHLADIDANIDTKIEDIDHALQRVASSMSADNAKASGEFHSVLTHTISAGLLISLIGVVAAFSISALTTRYINLPLQRITQAAKELEQGNYRFKLIHQSGDEFGVLANAFRAMSAQVMAHTEDLQTSNELLKREVSDRIAAEAKVAKLNSELEGQVEQRTAELSRANQELKRVNEENQKVIVSQREVEAQLTASHKELRSLSQHLQDVREEERTSIAREIHDELGQLLTALKIDLSWLGGKLPAELKHLLDKTATMMSHIDMTIRTVQRISAELRPGMLDDLGLAAAIEWQTKEFQEKTGITCIFDNRLGSDCLDSNHATALFRIFQETLTNIYRHARATHAWVTLSSDGDSVVASVSDDGVGISEQVLTDPNSLGLIGMRERVRFFGGTVTIGNQPGGGTEVLVVIPLGKTHKEDES